MMRQFAMTEVDNNLVVKSAKAIHNHFLNRNNIFRPNELMEIIIDEQFPLSIRTLEDVIIILKQTRENGRLSIVNIQLLEHLEAMINDVINQPS